MVAGHSVHTEFFSNTNRHKTEINVKCIRDSWDKKVSALCVWKAFVLAQILKQLGSDTMFYTPYSKIALVASFKGKYSFEFRV